MTEQTTTVTVPFAIRKRGGRKIVITPDGTASTPAPRARVDSGKWRVNSDTVCFQYGQDPEACWQVKLDGDQVTWVKDGKDDGIGTIVKGNPNNFRVPCDWPPSIDVAKEVAQQWL